ncbi:glycosyltransferase family 2 protein [Gephyromycinifex aptenodytis]|uniref:glycosyltransferase family 2 protein n=1 Tax=Gephyromycinifex aptenodytis TaxID=2716227 RepID=UPI001446E2E6|nr:glycosyltransferase [Gephyromycinifex aptenodytis]
MSPVPQEHPRPAEATVIIPAYNEERVIGRCLEALAPYLQPGACPRLAVIVVANGCRDNTAQVAAGFPGVCVRELSQGSKSLALNEGDALAQTHPRIYLDADITLSPESIPALVTALQTEQPVVGAPQIHFDVSRSSWPVKAFYRVFRELPYVRDGLVGLGVYGLSEAGRARFERFPDLVADDLYVQRLFAPHERRIVAGTFTVAAPRTIASLLAVRVRVAKGNAGLARHDPDERFAATTSSTGGALLRLLRSRPWLAPAVGVYAAVTLAARVRATRARPQETHSTAWERDDSTRR